MANTKTPANTHQAEKPEFCSYKDYWQRYGRFTESGKRFDEEYRKAQREAQKARSLD